MAAVGLIQKYRDLPIPITSHAISTRDYSLVPVDLTNPQGKETLVAISAYGIAGESYYGRTDGLNSPYYRAFVSAAREIYCRETVASKLQQINRRLNQEGLELFVWDAYRSVSCQQELWQFFMARARLTKAGATEVELERYVAEYCSDPRSFERHDSRTWPTHVTGGAVDLTLRRINTGEILFMGSTFDDPSPVSHTAYFESRPCLTASDVEARNNRRLLYWVMIDADFGNYPSEWWHFDWGTQMWSLSRRRGQPVHAVYGPAL